MKNRKGFTLTELLVVIAMIAVIGTVIIVNTVSINKRAKDTEYDRMIENIVNSAKTYVSLYPEEFGDLYSTKAFSFISLNELIHSGLLDEEIINPYTNKQLDLEDKYLGFIKAYVDGTSYEIVYKYPLTDDDYDTERYLVATTINTYEDAEKGFQAFYLFEGLEDSKASIDFGIADDNGNLIESHEGYPYLINRYKEEFKLTVDLNAMEFRDNFVKCSDDNINCTSNITWSDVDKDHNDFYYPNKTGTFEIKYNWEYKDKNNNVHKKTTTRLVRVTSATDREKEQINTDDSSCKLRDGEEIVFNYTGDVHKFTIPCSGKYTIEAYGGEGGGEKGKAYSPGKGGFATGDKTFSKDTIVYIAVGGAGAVANSNTEYTEGGFNGGGRGISHGYFVYNGSGGGATHIAYVDGTLEQIKITSINEIILVAAGGGGVGYTTNGRVAGGNGGAGGGKNGEICSSSNCSSMTAATQTKGGNGVNGGGDGSFGKGGDGASGGGGGLFGGGAHYSHYGGGGGSSFIDNVDEGTGRTETGLNEGNGYLKLIYHKSE